MFTNNTDNFFFDLKVYSRKHVGRTQNKKLRFNNMLTASMETLDSKNILLGVMQKCVTNLLKKINYNTTIIRLFLDEKRYFVIIKEIQKHPYKTNIINIVFKEVVSEKKVLVDIPVIVIGEKDCEALQEGCKLEKKLEKISLRCSVQSIPRYLKINVKFLKSGSIVHIFDIPYLENFGIVPDNFKNKLILKITQGYKSKESAVVKKEIVAVT